MTKAKTTDGTHDTAIGAAFRAAGYETNGDKLFRLMQEAILANGGIADTSIDAFIKALLAEEDAGLIWEFVAEVRMPSAKALPNHQLPRVRPGARQSCE